MTAVPLLEVPSHLYQSLGDSVLLSSDLPDYHDYEDVCLERENRMMYKDQKEAPKCVYINFAFSPLISLLKIIRLIKISRNSWTNKFVYHIQSTEFMSQYPPHYAMRPSFKNFDGACYWLLNLATAVLQSRLIVVCLHLHLITRQELKIPYQIIKWLLRQLRGLWEVKQIRMERTRTEEAWSEASFIICVC